MTEQIIELVSGVRARLVPGAFPAAGVRWMGGYVCIGVAPTHPDYAALAADTTGSSTDGIDEWRFHLATGEMVSAYWGIPSVDASWDEWGHVLDLPRRGAGTLRLLERRTFLLPQTMIGAFDVRGSALIGIMKGTRPSDVEYGIEIAPDVVLFVSRGRHCGWALLRPTDKGCLRGEELLPLPSYELAAAREPLAQTLAAIFDLYTDDGVSFGAEALERKLDEIGASLARRVSPVAARVLMHGIERWYVNKFITPANAIAPWLVAEMRHLKTGELFKASDRDARGLRRTELHPLVRERAEVAERIVLLHRKLRWPDPKLFDARPVNSRTLRDWLRAQPELIIEQMAATGIAAEATGLSTLDQFARVNDVIAAQERHNGGRPLRMLDWMRHIEAIGTHGEVKAMHDALSAASACPEGRSRKKAQERPPAACSAPVDARSALGDLELSLTRVLLDNEAGDRPAPRCVHCQFITHGVIPDQDLARAEARTIGRGECRD